jgi:hypothetical protein
MKKLIIAGISVFVGGFIFLFICLAMLGSVLSACDSLIENSQIDTHEPVNSIDIKSPDKSKEKFTLSQKNAIESAKNYIEYQSFSEKGLIEQLMFEKYDDEDANFAVKCLNIDWNEQAKKSAISYMEYQSFSKDGLIEQLEYEGFTHEQAVYGAESAGY